MCDVAEGSDYRPSRSAASQRDAEPEYDEYEGADDFDEEPPRRTAASSSRSARPAVPPKTAAKAPAKPVEKPKEVNLFDFDDDDTPAAPAQAPAAADFGGDGKSQYRPDEVSRANIHHR